MDEETPDLTPMSSPMNDVRKLKANSAASADELLSWLAKMRGKSPREVLGTVAQSNLFKSLIQSVILMSILIFTWTGGVWGYENFVKKDKMAATESGESSAEKSAKGQTKEPEETKIPENVANPDKAKMPDLDVANKLGIGETKEAPTNSNPLDDTTDDILKGLE